jgi:hypothetical protein
MSTTTFPVSGSFGGRQSKPVRRAPVARPAVQAPAVQAAAKPAPWYHFFGNAFAAWASAGRIAN